MIPLFHSFFSPTQSGQNGSSLALYPDSLFLQTNGELIQILGTPRHSRALGQARLRRNWEKSRHESAPNLLSVPSNFAFFSVEIRPKYRRPPSPSNGSHRGDTLDLLARLLPPLLSKFTALIGYFSCRSFKRPNLNGYPSRHCSGKKGACLSLTERANVTL